MMPPHIKLHYLHIGNKPHSISGWFKVGSRWLVNAYSSYSIPAPEGGGVQAHDAKGLVMSTKGVHCGHKGGWYT